MNGISAQKAAMILKIMMKKMRNPSLKERRNLSLFHPACHPFPRNNQRKENAANIKLLTCPYIPPLPSSSIPFFLFIHSKNSASCLNDFLVICRSCEWETVSSRLYRIYKQRWKANPLAKVRESFYPPPNRNWLEAYDHLVKILLIGDSSTDNTLQSFLNQLIIFQRSGKVVCCCASQKTPSLQTCSWLLGICAPARSRILT